MPEFNDYDDRPETIIQPPLIMLIAIIIGLGARIILGGRLPLPEIFGEILGAIFILIAIAIFQLGVTAFAEGGELLRPATPSRQLFTRGIYAYSRNPIYGAMMLLGNGLGLATLNIWLIMATILAGIVIHYFVILPEERYLEDRFGDDYEVYKKTVRRWI